jgi:hypothetical protein
MQMRGKILALLRAGWDRLVSWFKVVVDPPPGAIGWYILAVLGIAIGGNVLFTALFDSPKPSAPKHYSLASPPAGIVVSLPKRSEYLTPLKTIKPQPPAATVKAADASKDKKKLYRKKEPACSWPFC